MRFLYIFGLLVIGCRPTPAKIEVDQNSIGAILLDSTVVAGTGFVIMDGMTVICCNHELNRFKENVQFRSRSGFLYPLSIVKTLPEYDLALLSSRSLICDQPLTIDEGQMNKVHDSIKIISYDSRLSANGKLSFRETRSVITEIGKLGFVDYIGYNLDAIPGYSGSPVLSAENKVIGIHTGGLHLFDEKKHDLNVAYSILPLFER